MEAKNRTLKLCLDEMGVEAEIGEIENRIRLQKAVYLAQRLGADLGYRFSWYLRGPYSTNLTADYYSLKEALNVGDDDSNEFELIDNMKTQLRRAKELFQVPQDVELEDEHEWLELLASLDYLIKVSGMDLEGARETLETKKAELAPFTNQAFAALRRFNLVG
ncbi:MAG TPA: hypothetical protein DDW52_16520 [Planctomycetaceae bacterium]|nr:hypothetical protein [Planctomycetaceae bacterium]